METQDWIDFQKACKRIEEIYHSVQRQEEKLDRIIEFMENHEHPKYEHPKYEHPKYEQLERDYRIGHTRLRGSPAIEKEEDVYGGIKISSGPSNPVDRGASDPVDRKTVC